MAGALARGCSRGRAGAGAWAHWLAEGIVVKVLSKALKEQGSASRRVGGCCLSGCSMPTTPHHVQLPARSCCVGSNCCSPIRTEVRDPSEEVCWHSQNASQPDFLGAAELCLACLLHPG